MSIILFPDKASASWCKINVHKPNYKNVCTVGEGMLPNTTDKKQELEISDIRQIYTQQWVTVDITKRDKYGLPLLGRVILHSKSKKDIVDQIGNTEGYLYVFYSGSIDDDVD